MKSDAEGSGEEGGIGHIFRGADDEESQIEGPLGNIP